MRIFTAIRHSTTPGAFYEDLWRSNFYPALRRLGHEIIESQTDLSAGSAEMGLRGEPRGELAVVRRQATQSILDEFDRAQREKPIDLFLSYFYNSHFDPRGFDAIHAAGVLTVNFYCNSIHQFELVADVARKARFSWHAEKHARESYLKIGAHPVWVQMGADPDVYRPIPTPEPRLAKAVFIGQRYADRDSLAAAILRQGVPLDLYGSGWKRGAGGASAPVVATGHSAPAPGTVRAYLQTARNNWRDLGWVGGTVRTIKQALHRRASRKLDPILATAAKGRAEDVAKTFSQYELCLNFSNVWHDARTAGRLVPHVRLRDFEAPMCGAALLTGHTDEIEEFFVVGQEIDTYRDEQELVDKSKFYLANPAAAERLRAAGRRRALADHTWDCRFRQLFREIGMAAK